MEAETRMRIVPWEWWLKADPGKRMWVFSCNMALMPGIRRYARLVGTKYDYKNLVWHALRRVFGKLMRRPWRSPRRLLCSELLVEIMRTAEVPGIERLDPEASTPGDLVEFWKKSWVFKSVEV